MNSKDVGRYRPSRHYFLLRVTDFSDFKDPDVFSPHMDLMFLRKVYTEFRNALEQTPDFIFQQHSIPSSTPYVVASRPERAARDLAKRFLVSKNAKYEIRIDQRHSSSHFTLRYRQQQNDDDSWSAPIRIERDLVHFSDEPYADHVHAYKNVEIPSLSQEKVFVQFFRLEPSFQFYEYAATLKQSDDGDDVILVKSMFRPFLVKQGRTVFVQNANSLRDAFKKASSKLKNNHVRITITDVFDRHRYVNDAGTVQYKFRRAPVVEKQFKRRADSKRKRIHCIEKTFLFEKGNVRHVIPTTFKDDDGAFYQRDLAKRLKHAILKFLRMARSTRLDERQKESMTFDMLKNRWFLVACASLSNDDAVNALLQRAMDALHARNRSGSQMTQPIIKYADIGRSMFEMMYELLADFDVDSDEVPYEEFLQEIEQDDVVETLEERNLPIPQSPIGCEDPLAKNVTTQGHEPFPTDLLSGSETRSFGEFERHQTNYTRDDVIDAYVKHIRDDLKRIAKRTNDDFIQYLASISVYKEEEEEEELHFGSRQQPFVKRKSLYERILRALFGS